MVRAAFALCQQGIVQTWTGDYLAAVTSDEQALPLAHGSGDQHAEACALQFLADAQRLTGDPAAQHVQESLERHRLPSTTPGAPARAHCSKGHRPAAYAVAPKEAVWEQALS